MTLLGAFLLVVGLCDLLRAASDITSTRRRLLLTATGLVLLVLLGAILGLSATDGLGVGVLWAAGFVGWIWGSAAALDPPPARSTRAVTRSRALALASLGLPGLLLLLVGDTVGLRPVTPTWLQGSQLDHWGLPRSVTWAGILLVQLSSANVAVRLLLDWVGVLEADAEKQLRGGRLLGPMERLFLVALGAGGYVAAAAVVVAAKGLLRFPDLTRGQPAGPTDVSEYFLVGSFASWLVALGGVVLLRLTG